MSLQRKKVLRGAMRAQIIKFARCLLRTQLKLTKAKHNNKIVSHNKDN